LGLRFLGFGQETGGLSQKSYTQKSRSGYFEKFFPGNEMIPFFHHFSILFVLNPLLYLAEHLLYVNPVNVWNILTKILAKGKLKIPSWSRGVKPRGTVRMRPECKPMSPTESGIV
jgi:hypothetical protein